MKRRCDRLEDTVEKLLKEVAALKSQDAKLQENITQNDHKQSADLSALKKQQEKDTQYFEIEVNRLKQENRD